MVSMLQHALASIEPMLAAYGAVVIFAVIYLESFGVPLPGESALVASAVLATRGDLSMPAVMAAAWAGAVLGDTTGYAIGRFGGRPLLRRVGPWLGLTGKRFEQLSDLFRRRGTVVVVAARFIVVLRQLNGLVAGTLEMPFRRFVAANVIGSGLWVGVWGGGSYAFGDWIKAYL
jgi:membrane protein DedA with SNARE-associated domain